VLGRDVPDSGQPVLPAGNCVSGEYWPVLGCLFRYYANGRRRPTAAVCGNTSGVRRLCVLILEPD